MMKNKINFQLLILIMLMATSVHMYAQITVGSNEDPVRAALLDIKDQPADADNATATVGGMVLPRVKLEKKDDLSPFIKITDPEWQASTRDATKASHTGLTVYNLTNDSYFSPGMYVWNGKSWVPVIESAQQWSLKGNSGTNPVANFIGTTDLAALSIRTGGKERLHISEKGEITAKNNLKVEGKSTLNGNVYMHNVPVTASSNVSQIAIDSTGRVCKIQTSSGNTKMFSYMKYTLRNVEGDWVKDFDTKIPSEQYTLIVVGSNFITRNQTDILYTSSGKGYNPQEVYAKVSGSTWRLVADYRGGSPQDSNNKVTNGTWEIDCIAINNAIVKTISDSNSLNVGLGGKSTGASPNKPNGL
ncbi:MAG: hypothetical protein LBH32_08975 [Dysgonamonadaceae bacterium]|jgi:hypothetical protein|nr:hypothetical protein [Dysgonamonadaceae bacterium]